MLRDSIKRILHPFLKRWYRYHYRKPQSYSYNGITIEIQPGVFSPKLTIGTRVFLEFIDQFDLDGKTVLELGAGSGLISFFSERKGALVTASDISEAALNGLRKNKEALNARLVVIHSDLFEALPDSFDYIFVNPPYYPRKAQNEEELAWFCGEEFEYFQRFFEQVSQRNSGEEIYMILSQDCDLERITQIANKNGISLEKVYETSKWKEVNTIFRLGYK